MIDTVSVHLGYYAVSLDIWFLAFKDNIAVSSSHLEGSSTCFTGILHDLVTPDNETIKLSKRQEPNTHRRSITSQTNYTKS